MTSLTSTISIIVNGEPVSVSVDANVEALLRQLEYKLPAIAVERNYEILAQKSFATCVLADGDNLEIVSLVGGG